MRARRCCAANWLTYPQLDELGIHLDPVPVRRTGSRVVKRYSLRARIPGRYAKTSALKANYSWSALLAMLARAVPAAPPNALSIDEAYTEPYNKGYA